MFRVHVTASIGKQENSITNETKLLKSVFSLLSRPIVNLFVESHWI